MKKQLIFSICSIACGLYSNVSYSQNRIVDSIKVVLKKESDLNNLELVRINTIIECQKLLHNSIIIGSVLILVVAIILIRNYRNKINISQQLKKQTDILHKQEIANLLQDQSLKAVQAKLEGQQAERQRLAMDLHDSIGGILSGIKFKLLNSDSVAQKQELENLLDLACEEVRSISHNLMPVYLENSSFTDSIQNLIHGYKTTNGIVISLDFTSEEKLNQLPQDIQVEVYRILQELIKNSIKHSCASKLEIDISFYDNELTLLIEDNGKGFDYDIKTKGIGFKNIESRVNELGGRFQIDSQAKRGTAVKITIPVILIFTHE